MPGMCCRLSSRDSPISSSLRRPSSAQDEGIVEVGDEQNVLHAKGHESVKALKGFFRVEDGLGW